MEKLRLALDELTVTSFEVAPDGDGNRGTVEAKELAPTRPTRCGTCASDCDTCQTFCLPYC